MASTRDNPSEGYRADLDGLLDVVLPLAEQQLTLRGEFYPFGAAVSADGETSLTATEDDLGDREQSQAVLDRLYDVARARAHDQRAVAFVADVLARGSYAVRVELEHEDGVALVVLLPYTRTWFKKKVTLGRMTVTPGQARVWGEAPQIP
ncbi:hypothetical protein [Nocardioides pelophilus]|uniref:hypothetical protein n=1 Tax=Nocardioides pelophilus TaxID=2172019 RepID=UPI001601AD01|nr:hypothetical protein [Nocardioides pelophilus]